MKQPHPLVALIPVLVLIALLGTVISLFGSDSLSGGSQIALVLGTAVCIALSMIVYRVPWSVFEQRITKTIGNVAITLLILLAVGMLSGSWMISGVVPTLIYYGVQIMSPQFFLVSACVICALVSLLSGSSWTTVATMGVALLGISEALGINTAWTAGAIISGAYFGDKMSPLSDTTILASSATQTDLFVHIRYMMYTTVPTFLIALTIFFIAGFGNGEDVELHVAEYTEGLAGTFNISYWTLLVPALTGILISRHVPSVITLFASAIVAGIMALILKNHSKDFISGSEMDFVAYKSENIDIHHIFPRDYCEKSNLPRAKWNSIVNKTPISYSTNREIGGVAPSEYISKIEKKRKVSSADLDLFFESHWLVPNLLRSDAFDQFIVARAKALLDAIQNATGKTITGRDSEEVIEAFGAKLL